LSRLSSVSEDKTKVLSVLRFSHKFRNTKEVTVKLLELCPTMLVYHYYVWNIYLLLFSGSCRCSYCKFVGNLGWCQRLLVLKLY